MKVRGLSSTTSGYSLSDEALRALQSGDTQALINSHSRFAGWKMEDDNDDDDDNSGDGGDDDNDNSGDSGSGDGDDGDDGDSGDGDDDDTKAEIEKLKKRLKAADQRASKAEKKIQDQENAKKDDLTKAQDRVTELETQVGELQGQLQSERLNNAFLAANKHTWHKPGSALKLAQSEGYLDDVVDDDGSVSEKALSSALSKLAKEHPYLVKPSGSGSSGDSAGGRSGNNKDDKATKDEDRRRAPALNRRR